MSYFMFFLLGLWLRYPVYSMLAAHFNSSWPRFKCSTAPSVSLSGGSHVGQRRPKSAGSLCRTYWLFGKSHMMVEGGLCRVHLGSRHHVPAQN